MGKTTKQKDAEMKAAENGIGRGEISEEITPLVENSPKETPSAAERPKTHFRTAVQAKTLKNPHRRKKQKFGKKTKAAIPFCRKTERNRFLFRGRKSAFSDANGGDAERSPAKTANLQMKKPVGKATGVSAATSTATTGAGVRRDREFFGRGCAGRTGRRCGGAHR